MKKLFIGIAAISMALGVSGVPASANTVQVDWFSVNPSTADFNLLPCGGGQDCSQNFSNEVGASLSGSGTSARPVVGAGNPAGLAESVGAVLPWWTNGGGVTYEGTSTKTLAINQNMFTPMGNGTSGDSTAFQTAVFYANIHVLAGGQITFGGDDDMFLALNGTVVDQVGGIHPAGSQYMSTYNVAAGDYFMQVFYADRHVVDAHAYLDVNSDITTSGPPYLTTGVPEPSTWAMMILGFFGVGFMAYRRNSKPAFMAA